MTIGASVRKKVLFVITKSNWGGAQRYVFDLATHLPRDQFDVAVAMGGTGAAGAPVGALQERLKSVGISTIFVQSFIRDISLMREWHALWELVAIFKQEHPDVVHLNSSKAGGIGSLAARIAGVENIVFTVHGLPEDEPRSAFSQFLIAIFSYFTLILCHRVITITKDNYDRVRSRPGCSRKTDLIHNGIDPSMVLFSREMARHEITKKPVDEIGNRVWIGSIGELNKNKNYDMALRAIALAQHQNSNLFYVIIGNGEDQEKLASLAQSLNLGDSVHFAGFKADAARLLPAFDVFFLPSLKEGLPYVLLEAGAASLSVVASSVGGIPEVIESKSNGILINPRSTQDAAQALSALAESEQTRKEYGTQLNEKVTAEYSLERMVQQTAHVY